MNLKLAPVLSLRNGILNVGAVEKGYSESNNGVAVQTSTDSAPEPTARPEEEIGENEAPF